MLCYARNTRNVLVIVNVDLLYSYFLTTSYPVNRLQTQAKVEPIEQNNYAIQG